MNSLTPSDIVKQLRIYLPWYSSRFVNFLSIESAVTVLPNSIQVVFTNDHNLEIGDVVIAKNMRLLNEVTNAEVVDEIAQITLSSDPDTTLPKKIYDPKTINLTGFSDSEWNGEKTFVDMLNISQGNPILKFTPPPTPAIPSGLGYLAEERPTFRGLWLVQNIISDTELVMERLDIPSFQTADQVLDNLEIYKTSNIVVAPTLERAAEMYTAVSGQDKIWLYVIPDGRRTSRDPHALTDAVAELDDGDSNLISRLMSFSTVVFIDTSNNISAGAALDMVYGEIDDALSSTLFGFKKTSDNNLHAVPTEDNLALYNTSYYAHYYNWQVLQHRDSSDAFDDPQDFALDKLVYIQHPEDLDNPEVLKAEIKIR